MPKMDEALFQFLLRMGDNTLVLGHRVSEWCGHSPVLEEDIADEDLVESLQKIYLLVLML